MAARSYRDFVPNRYRDYVPPPMPSPRPGDLIIDRQRPTLIVTPDGNRVPYIRTRR